ncbi:MAG: replication factor C large subunit [Candidatus Micrarchaeota archaeon]
MLPWHLKHAPKSVDEIAGNEESKEIVKKWALEWQRGKKQKALLVWGPPGVGKTALAFALAGEFDWFLVESSSSDVRTEKSLLKRFGGSGMQGLFGKRLLLIDDLDSVFDRGESSALIEMVENPVQPVLLCANDVWNPKLSKLRNECLKVEFKKINKTSVGKVLRKIAEKENAVLPEGFVEEIAESCHGDLRSAIIDLQGGFVSERDRREDVFKNLAAVFKGSFDSALKVETDDLDFFLRWIEENIPVEYERPEDVARAFDSFSRADVFSGRIMKRQNYGLLKFVRALGLGGVAAAKREPYRKFSRFQFPTVIRLLSSSKGERQMLKAISLKAAGKLHCSSKQALDALVLLPEKSRASLGLLEEENEFLKDWVKR